MRRQSWLTRLVLGSLVAGGLLAADMPMSKAQCPWGVVYLTRKNAEPIPVYGPDCIREEDWRFVTRIWDQKTVHEVPDGTVNGYYYEFVTAGP